MSLFESIKQHIKKEKILDGKVWLDDVEFLECFNYEDYPVFCQHNYHFLIPCLYSKKTNKVLDLRTGKIFNLEKGQEKFAQTKYKDVIASYGVDLENQKPNQCYSYSFYFVGLDPVGGDIVNAMKLRTEKEYKKGTRNTQHYVPIKTLIEFCNKFEEVKKQNSIDLQAEYDSIFKH